MTNTSNRVNWLNRERVIHEGVWDTLSRPLSRQSRPSEQKSPRSLTHSANHPEDEQMKIFNGTRVKWDHFGKKHNIRISDYEMEYADLYDVFLKKIYELCPDFEGRLAYIDQFGRQIVISSDNDIRDALDASGGRLKVHTMLTDGSVMAAADLVHRPAPYRSQSVPPERSYHLYPPAHSRAPSSLESAPPTLRRRALSPPPGPLVQAPNSISRTPVTYHQIPPPGYTYKYTTYGPYTQPILYGMPPTNGMLMRWLTNPFSHGYTRNWIGPYKWWGWGGPWGPIW